jgi:Flp pilus assembly protein TadG
MRTRAALYKSLKSERGSVLLEFCLMMPIWLLMFGGTFMLFDVSMARLHLQEANRNLAWLQDDRYDSQGLINGAVYSSAVQYFENRNALETGISGEPMWSFGDDYQKYSAKQGGKKSESPQFWGSAPDSFNEGGVEIAVNNSVTEGLSSLTGGLLSDKLENGYMNLRTGNMALEMKRVSAVYIGAIGLSSVLFPGEEGDGFVPLYQSTLTFTRAQETSQKGKSKPKAVNGEMLLMRRRETDRDKVKNVNDLFQDNTINRSWPSNGSLGDAQLLLGI